jgi:tRNA threonylcarbamoyladenosine biosynthesis protein TsaB
MTPTLLAIETATDVCSVALAHGDAVRADLTLNRPRAHAENLVPMIEEALRLGGMAARDLDAVAVSAGPGSYTGLRIGVSTAKGLALAADAALVAIPTLEALAVSATVQAEYGDYVCALLNARRHERYAAVYRIPSPQRLAVHQACTVLATADLADWLDVPAGARCWLVGEGSPQALPMLDRTGHLHLRLLDPSVIAPTAARVARLALTKLLDGHTEDVARFEPLYLKSFVAKTPKHSMFEKLSF